MNVPAGARRSNRNVTAAQSAERVARVALRIASSKTRSGELYGAPAPTSSASIVPGGPVGLPDVPQLFRLCIGRLNATVSDPCVPAAPTIPGSVAWVGVTVGDGGAGVGVLPGDAVGAALGVAVAVGVGLGAEEAEPLGVALVVALDAGEEAVVGVAVGAGVDGRAVGKPSVPDGAAPEQAPRISSATPI